MTIQTSALRRVRWRGHFVNLALSMAALAVVFVLAELAARALFPVENLGTVVRFDPDLGWSLIPGSRTHSVDRAKGLDYVIQINSLGMRERELQLAPKQGTQRMLFIGDSITFGSGVDSKWRFTDRIGRALTADFEVINAAVPGWGTDQELLYYELFGDQLRPDVVVLTFFMLNDVINNSLDHLYLGTAPKPRFVLRGDSLILERAIRPRLRPGSRIRNVVRQSHFLQLVKRRIDPAPRDREPVVGSVPPGFDRAHGRVLSHWSVFETGYDSTFETAWRTTEALLLRFSDQCEKRGVKLVLFAFPSVESDERWRAELLRDAGMESAELDFRAPFSRLGEFCRRNGIDFVYPLETFRTEAGLRPLFFEHDGHANRVGHAVAARALLEWLRDHRYLQFAEDRL